MRSADVTYVSLGKLPGGVDPARQTVTVYRSLTETQQLGVDDTTAEPILPGFSVPIRRFF